MLLNGSEPKYKKAEDMLIVGLKHLKDCEGEVLRDNNGDVVTDKSGRAVMIGVRPKTITGLALALGFKSRQSLLNYQGRSQAFNDVITYLKSMVEEYAESRLFDRDGAHGAKFTLINNFKGWRDKPADIVLKSDAEVAQLYKALTETGDKTNDV